MSSLSFIDYLEAKLDASGGEAKRVRTLRKLKLAAATVLGKRGFAAMRTLDVTLEAGMAEGSFYVYFRSKEDVTRVVLTEFLSDFFLDRLSVEAENDSYAVVAEVNKQWFRLCRANSGLMRCVLQVGDQVPEVSQIAQRTNRLWYERVARHVSLKAGSSSTADSTLLLAYFLGAMIDEITRKMVLYPDPEFLALMSSLGAVEDDVAEALSVVWVRLLYPSMPLRSVASSQVANLVAAWTLIDP